MSPGEIAQILANLQAATARSQYTATSADAANQNAQNMQAAEYAKKMEDEQVSGFTKMLPTIAGIAGSFIPGVGIVAGPALAAATAAATGQDALGAGLGALGGGLMGAATKGVTGAIGSGLSQGAAEGATDTLAQAATTASQEAALETGKLAIRGTDALADAAVDAASEASQQAAVETGKIGLRGTAEAITAAETGTITPAQAAGMVSREPIRVGATQTAAQGATQGAAQPMAQAGTPMTADARLMALMGQGNIAALPETSALNVGQTGGQLTMQNAPKPGFFEQVGDAMSLKNLNASMRDNAMQQLGNLPGYTAQSLVSNGLQTIGQGIYDRNAPMSYQGGGYGPATGAPGAGGGYIDAGPYSTNPYVYDPATQGVHPNMARMAQENIPYKDQFMMALGQGLQGLGQQYALDQANRVEIPERPFGLNPRTASEIEAPYREAAAKRQEQAIEQQRFNAEMGLRNAQFGETIRSNKATEGYQQDRLELERSGQKLEERRVSVLEKDFKEKWLREPTPEQAATMRAVEMGIAEQNAKTAAQNAATAGVRAQTEKMRAEQEAQLAPLRERLLNAELSAQEAQTQRLTDVARANQARNYTEFIQLVGAEAVLEAPLSVISAAHNLGLLSTEEASARINATIAANPTLLDDPMMGLGGLGGAGGSTGGPTGGSVPFAGGLLDATVGGGAGKSNVTPEAAGEAVNPRPSAPNISQQLSSTVINPIQRQLASEIEQLTNGAIGFGPESKARRKFSTYPSDRELLQMKNELIEMQELENTPGLLPGTREKNRARYQELYNKYYQ